MKKIISVLLVIVLVVSALTVGVLASREPGGEPGRGAARETERGSDRDEGRGRGSGEASEEEPAAAPGAMTGGWTAAESPEITDELQALLDKAFEGLLGVNYVPVAELATQVVAGRNHCVLCQATTVYPGAQPYYALVYVYEGLDGSAKVLDIVPLDVGALRPEAAE